MDDEDQETSMHATETETAAFYDDTNVEDQRRQTTDVDEELSERLFGKGIKQKRLLGYQGLLLILATADAISRSPRARKHARLRAERLGRETEDVEFQVAHAAVLLARQSLRERTLVRKNGRSVEVEPQRDLTLGHLATVWVKRACRYALADLSSEGVRQPRRELTLKEEVLDQHPTIAERNRLAVYRQEPAERNRRAREALEAVYALASPRTQELLDAWCKSDNWADAARRIGMKPTQAYVMLSRLRNRLAEAWPGRSLAALLAGDGGQAHGAEGTSVAV